MWLNWGLSEKNLLTYEPSNFFFPWKMRKRVSILSWRLFERILHKIAGVTLHPSTQGFFSSLWYIDCVKSFIFGWLTTKSEWNTTTQSNYAMEKRRFAAFFSIPRPKSDVFRIRKGIQTYIPKIELVSQLREVSSLSPDGIFFWWTESLFRPLILHFNKFNSNLYLKFFRPVNFSQKNFWPPKIFKKIFTSFNIFFNSSLF